MKRNYKSNFSRLLYNDLRYGTKRNLLKFLIVLLFTVLCCIHLDRITAIKILSGKVKEMPGFYDYVVYILGGIKEFVQTKEKEFEVPFIWATYQMLVGFAVLTYPINDLEGRGMAILIKSQNRKNGWISKCIWSVIQVMCIYAILWIGIIVSFFVIGGNSFALNQDICIEIIGVSLKNPSEILSFAIILPLISSIMFALTQISFSLFIGPILSLTLVFSYQIISSYMMNAFLLGNYSMLLRSNHFVGSGLSVNAGIIAEICISIIAVVVGGIYFKKYDVLEKE